MRKKVPPYKSSSSRVLAMNLIKRRFGELGFRIFAITKPRRSYYRNFIAVKPKSGACWHPYEILVVIVELKRDGRILIRPYWNPELYKHLPPEIEVVFQRHQELRPLFSWGPPYTKMERLDLRPSDPYGWLRLIPTGQRKDLARSIGIMK